MPKFVWDVVCKSCGCPRSRHATRHTPSGLPRLDDSCACGHCDKFEPRTVHDAWALEAERRAVEDYAVDRRVMVVLERLGVRAPGR